MRQKYWDSNQYFLKIFGGHLPPYSYGPGLDIKCHLQGRRILQKIGLATMTEIVYHSVLGEILTSNFSNINKVHGFDTRIYVKVT